LGHFRVGERRHLDVDADRGRHAYPHGTLRFPVGRKRQLQRCEVRMDEFHRQPGSCRGRVEITMKTKSIVYWTMTGLVAFFIGGGGIAQVAQYQRNPHGIVPVLGYPMYFFAILGIWKVLGAIAILVPRFPRLKEWAYAGIFFDLTGASASSAAVGGSVFHILAPLVGAVLAVASWALRPESRTIGVLFPAKGQQASISANAANVGSGSV